MIEGEVIGWEPAVALTVLGPAGGVSLSAVIDTGFTGDLTLPSALIEQLGLGFLAVEQTSLADDKAEDRRTFDADVLWDDEQRRVVVIEMGSTPLIGMGLLSGFRLTIESIEGEGSLRVERISPLFATDE